MGNSCSSCSCQKQNEYVQLNNLVSRKVKRIDSDSNLSDISISEQDEIVYVRFETGLYVKPNKCVLIVQIFAKIAKPNGLTYLPNDLTNLLISYIGRYTQSNDSNVFSNNLKQTTKVHFLVVT